MFAVVLFAMMWALYLIVPRVVRKLHQRAAKRRLARILENL